MATQISELILRLRDEVSANAGVARKSLQGLQSQVNSFISGSLSIGTEASGIVASIFALAKSSANYSDELGKAAQRTGIGVESLSGLKFAAAQADVEFEQLGVGISRFSKHIVQASQGNGELKSAFDALGVSLVDNDGKLKTTEDILLQVAQKFRSMEDGTAKTALAIELFGRSGASLIPFFNQGKAGIVELTEEARKLGLVVGTEAAARAEGFNDQLKIMTAVVKGLKNAIGGELIPVIFNFIRNTADTLNFNLPLPQNIGAINLELERLAERRRALFLDIEKGALPLFGEAQGAAAIEKLKADLADVIAAQNRLLGVKNQLAAVTKSSGDEELKQLEEKKFILKEVTKLQEEITKNVVSEGRKAANEIGKAIVERGGDKGLPFIADITDLRKQFSDPFFTDFGGLKDRLIELRQKIIDAFGTSVFDKAPGLLKDLDELQGRLKQFAEFKGIEITADGSQALREADKVKKSLASIPGASFDARGSTTASLEAFSGISGISRAAIETFGSSVIPGPIFAPQMTGSPTLPATEYLDSYLPGKVQEFVDKANGQAITFDSNFSSAIVGTLNEIIKAKEELARTTAFTPFATGIIGDFSIGPRARLESLEQTLGFLLGIGTPAASPSTSSGQRGAPNITIDLRGATISQELLDRKLVPAFESAVKSATGQQVSYRVLN